jgi:hypothetical protein
MRMWTWAGALVVALGLAAPAFAQRVGTIDPSTIINIPINTNQSVAPIAQPQLFNRRTFSLADILPNISFGAMSGKRVIGMSTYPTADGLPGKDYLKAFGFHRPGPIR